MMNKVQFQGVVIQRPEGKLNQLKNKLLPDAGKHFKNVASRNVSEKQFGITGATISFPRNDKFTTLFGEEAERYSELLKEHQWPEKRRAIVKSQDALVQQIIDESNDVKTVDIKA